MSDTATSNATATKALEYIIETVAMRGYPPTFRELGRHVGISSSSTAQKLVLNLVHRGWIGYDPSKPRTIIVTKTGAGIVGAPKDPVKKLRAENARLRAIIAEARQGNLAALENV